MNTTNTMATRDDSITAAANRHEIDRTLAKRDLYASFGQLFQRLWSQLFLEHGASQSSSVSSEPMLETSKSRSPGSTGTCSLDIEGSRRTPVQIESPYAVSVAPAPHSSSVTQIESSRLVPWMCLACLLGGMSFGAVIFVPSLIDAKVQAGVAQANATATTANQHARIALDKVEDFRTRLSEKGINVTLDGH